MKLVAGLGNPGPRYAESRHNIGYLVVDELARRWATEVTRYDRDFEGLIGETQACGQRVLLLKPSTFMNLSGRSVAAALRFYKLAAADVLIAHDDLDLPVGLLRARASGTAGGHNGMSDVLRQLGTDEIARLRVGIGRVHPSAAVEYVLSRFEPDERPAIADAVGRAADAVVCWLQAGIDAAMNRFNRRQDREPGPKAADPRSQGESS